MKPLYAGPDVVVLKRNVAAALIEKIREMAAETKNEALTSLLEEHGIPALAKCTGEAHANAHIDNCMVCAPRWGFLGKHVFQSPKEPRP